MMISIKTDQRVHTDPLRYMAQKIAMKNRLLCLDEFQVTDITDALILKNLFKLLFEHHLVLVATSNHPPEDLYYQGLQRHLFLPFIDVLKNECKIVNLEFKKPSVSILQQRHCSREKVFKIIRLVMLKFEKMT